MRSLILIIYPYTILHKLVQNLFKARKTLEIKKIPNPNYDEGYLGYLKSNPNSDDFGEVGSGEGC